VRELTRIAVDVKLPIILQFRSFEWASS